MRNTFHRESKLAQDFGVFGELNFSRIQTAIQLSQSWSHSLSSKTVIEYERSFCSSFTEVCEWHVDTGWVVKFRI
jgi:hypothetical protein